MLLIGMTAAGFAQQPYYGQQPYYPPARRHFRNVIPPGTQIQVRTQGPVKVAEFDQGRVYPAIVARNVFARDGDLAIPGGSPCQLVVRQIGPRELTLDLQSISVNGRQYGVDASGPAFRMHSGGNNGGLVGSIIGAISGNRNVEYRGNRIRVPAGAVLTFQLQAPLRVMNAGYGGYHH